MTGGQNLPRLALRGLRTLNEGVVFDSVLLPWVFPVQIVDLSFKFTDVSSAPCHFNRVRKNANKKEIVGEKNRRKKKDLSPVSDNVT